MNDSQKWMLLIATLLVSVLLYLLSPVLTPFFIAALLAYLGDPLVDRLETYKLGRTLAVSIVFSIIFLLLTLVLVFLMPMLESQISYLLKSLPAHLNWIQRELMPALAARFDLDPQAFNLDALRQLISQQWSSSGSNMLNIFKSISDSGLVIMVWLANLVLIPVVTFYLLRDWDILLARVHELLPRAKEPVIKKLVVESDNVLAAFLRGQFMVMIVLGIIYALGLKIIGLELALLIGMLAGLVSFVPYLGFIVGIVTAGVAMLLQTQDILQIWPVVIVFGIGQALEGMLLTPLLVGDKIGLHPVAVIFSVLAGGQLFGFVGILLALPVAAIIAVLLRHMHQQYLTSSLYDTE
ncbi:MAG: AI-2E family transporter [Gammaproteobacteria bacterium]|nr:AI-2E family transporter [Gammaproteobacteria bacterium]